MFTRIDAKPTTRTSTRGSGCSSAPSGSRDGERGQGWHPDEWRARSVDETRAAATFASTPTVPRSDQPVAVGALEVTRDDNLAFIEGNLFVDPDRAPPGLRLGDARRTRSVRARTASARRCVIFVIEGSGEIGTGPNRSFAARHGYRVAEENVRRDLAWPRPDGELDRLWDEWRALRRRTTRSSRGPTPRPKSCVDGRAHLSAIMPAEAPHVDIDVEAEHWDAARVRLHEATTDPMGRDLLVAAARHRATGELVGYSELTVSRDQPQTAYQWDTLVIRSHRGHRLGGLLKVDDHAPSRGRSLRHEEDHDLQLGAERSDDRGQRGARGAYRRRHGGVAQGPLGVDRPRALDDHLVHLVEVHVIRTDPTEEPVDPGPRPRRRIVADGATDDDVEVFEVGATFD